MVLGRGSGTGEERTRWGSAGCFRIGEEEWFPVIEGEVAASVWMLRSGLQ
jgi:hypothetical protein